MPIGRLLPAAFSRGLSVVLPVWNWVQTGLVEGKRWAEAGKDAGRQWNSATPQPFGQVYRSPKKRLRGLAALKPERRNGKVKLRPQRFGLAKVLIRPAWFRISARRIWSVVKGAGRRSGTRPVLLAGWW